MATKATTVDWERIEVLYRAGGMSVREIATEFCVSHTAIQKRATKGEWTRDLKAKVKAEADAKVARALVATEVATETKVTEKLTVEVEATVQARIRLAHRSDIATSRRLAMALLAELEHQTLSGDDYQHLGDLIISGAKDDGANPQRIQKLTESFERALSLSGRVKTMKDLADTLRILVDKEREAFGIADGNDDQKGKSAADAMKSFVVALRERGSGTIPIARSGR